MGYLLFAGRIWWERNLWVIIDSDNIIVKIIFWVSSSCWFRGGSSSLPSNRRLATDLLFFRFLLRDVPSLHWIWWWRWRGICLLLFQGTTFLFMIFRARVTTQLLPLCFIGIFFGNGCGLRWGLKITIHGYLGLSLTWRIYREGAILIWLVWILTRQ